MKVTSEELAKEIARTTIKYLIPRIRKVIREEIETSRKTIIIENNDVDNEEDELVVNEHVSRDKSALRNKIRSSIKSDSFYSDFIENAGDGDISFNKEKPLIDSKTIQMAGKLTLEQLEQKAKKGEYIDPSAADYSSIIGYL